MMMVLAAVGLAVSLMAVKAINEEHRDAKDCEGERRGTKRTYV